jgi:hypothetical protein
MPKLAVGIAVNAVSECAQFTVCFRQYGHLAGITVPSSLNCEGQGGDGGRIQSGTFKLFWIQQCPAQEVGFLLKVVENWLNRHLFQQPAFHQCP